MKVKVLVVSNNSMATTIYGRLKSLDQIDFFMICSEQQLARYKKYPVDLVVWARNDNDPIPPSIKYYFPGAVVISIGPGEEIEAFPFRDIVNQILSVKIPGVRSILDG